MLLILLIRPSLLSTRQGQHLSLYKRRGRKEDRSGDVREEKKWFCVQTPDLLFLPWLLLLSAPETSGFRGRQSLRDWGHWGLGKEPYL